MTVGPRPWIAVAVLAAAIQAVYGGALSNEFVFDDHPLVVENPAVRLPLRDVVRLLDPKQPGVTYRPLRVLSYMVDHAVAGGLDPRVFRATNLLLHLCTSLLVLALARRCGIGFPASLAGASLFAVHPLASEAVVYVSGRRDLLCAVLTIGAVLVWRGAVVDLEQARHTPGNAAEPRLRRWFACGLLAILALGAKETAIVAPLLAGLLMLIPPVRPRALLGLRPWAVWGGFAAVAALLLALLYAPAVGRVLGSTNTPLAPQPQLTIVVLARYLELVVWPSTLLADYRGDALLPRVPESIPWLPLIGVAVWIGGGVALLRRGSLAGAGILWFVVALLPVLQIVPYREVVAEHNAYLALAGPALAIAAMIDAALERTVARLGVWFLIGLIAVALGVRTWWRCQDWRDDLTLWTRTIEDGGDGFRARFNCGLAELDAGRISAALRDLAIASQRDPESVPALLALGQAHIRAGDDIAAAALARRALDRMPSAQAFALLGWAELGRGDLAAADRAFEDALLRAPRLQEALRGRAMVAGRRKRDEAPRKLSPDGPHQQRPAAQSRSGSR